MCLTTFQVFKSVNFIKGINNFLLQVTAAQQVALIKRGEWRHSWAGQRGDTWPHPSLVPRQ